MNEISKAEVLAYYVSLGVNIYLLVILSLTGNFDLTVGPQAFADMRAIGVTAFLLAFEVATLGKHFIPTTEENAARQMAAFVATTRIETYALFILAGLFLNGSVELFNYAFLALDYALVTARVLVRLSQLEKLFPKS